MPQGKIIVVEDDSITALHLKDCLDNLGYEVIALLHSGEEALDRSRHLTPDLILMDIYMRGVLTGIEAAHQIREFLDVPIIFLTAYSDDTTIERAKLSDPYGYITKPFDEKDLLISIEMALNKHRLGKELRESEKRYRELYNNTPVMLHSINSSGAFVSVSKFWLESMGYSLNEVIGKQSTDFLTEESSRYAREIVLPDFFATGYCKDVSYQYVKKNGEIIDVLLSAIAERDVNGEIIRSLAVSIDVTERKKAENALRKLNEELEQRVLERTAQLEASNRELEAFSYSVSHDLRAPLRAIDGFARLLIEDYNESLSPDAQRYLRIIEENTRFMGHLIEDLLSFSRLNKQSLRAQPVKPGKIIAQVLEGLQDEIRSRGVKIEINECPPCEADPSLLRQVFTNLISNSLKFTRKESSASITIGSIEKDSKTVYFVRDNGVGFDMKYASRLFGVFQRLHRSDDFEGTGVGLAIVQRIVQRHGGDIWAESEPGRGAAFFFTLGAGKIENR